MKAKRKIGREHRAGAIEAHRAFDGRGRVGERGIRAQHYRSLGAAFPWYVADAEKRST